MWKCVYCEYENEESRRFCGGCGKDKDSSNDHPITPTKKNWIKVRLIGDNIFLYATPNADSPSVGVIIDQPVAELAVITDQWVEVKIFDGREGFIFDSKIVVMVLWSLHQDKAHVFAQPESSSSCIATLSRGDKFEPFGATITRDGFRWVPVMLPDGRTGYVEEGTQVSNHGQQFRIQESADDPGRYCVEGDLANQVSKGAIQHRELTIEERNKRALTIGFSFFGALIVIFSILMVGPDKLFSEIFSWTTVIFAGLLSLVYELFKALILRKTNNIVLACEGLFWLTIGIISFSRTDTKIHALGYQVASEFFNIQNGKMNDLQVHYYGGIALIILGGIALIIGGIASAVKNSGSDK